MAEPVVAAAFVQVKDRTVGLAVLKPRAREVMGDTTLLQLTLYQFIDQERYTSLEAMLVRHAVEQLYLCDLGEAENAKIEQLVESAPGMSLEVVSRAKFADADVLGHIAKLTGKDAAAADTEEFKLARKAAACLISKGGLLERPDADASVELCLGRHDAFMRLDAAALRALNLFPVPGQGSAATVGGAGAGPAGAAAPEEGDDASVALGGAGAGAGAGSSAAASASKARASKAAFARAVDSLHGLLSHGCRTKGGRKVLKSWILQPLVDLDAITQRQRLVSAFAESSALRTSWREGVSLPDLDALAARLNRKAATLMDLLRLYQFAAALPEIAKRLSAFDGEPAVAALLQEKYGAALDAAAGEFARYKEMCETIIEDVTAHEPRIAPSYKESLAALAEERQALEGSVLELFTDATRAGGWASSLDGELKCERDKTRGFVFRTKRTSEKALRAIPGAVITQVLKDGLYFTTSGAKGLRAVSERLMEVEAEYEREARTVVTEAVAIARSYTPVLEGAAAHLGELDALASMAHLAVSAPGSYVLPTMTAAGSGDIVVRGGRHPVMEMLEGSTFIPNDYVMRREGSRFVIVTGPNMGGKSTYIRTLGVICVMAQMGCLVPAEAATLPVLDCICARVGAGDKAVKGVSTFMAEMLEASTILSVATPASLVIVDELGRGTSTYDGFGLAWAISEHLAATSRCMTLFATHFHELTALAKRTAGVANRHVTAHTAGGLITMLYAVRDGPCPASFGIHVAEMAAFPKAVVATAREKAAQLEATSGSASALMMAGGEGAAGGAGAAAAGSTGAVSLATKAAAGKRVAAAMLAAPEDRAEFAAAPLDAKRQRVKELLEAPDAAGEGQG